MKNKIFHFNGNPVTFRIGKNVMVHTVEMAKPFSKTLKEWLRQKETYDILNSLADSTRCGISKLIPEEGNWVHEDVAIEFARWLDLDFSLWMKECIDTIHEQNKTNFVELIKIQERNGQQVVSARELHQFLGIGKDFTDWCKQMISYGFKKDLDFTPILGKSTGGRPSVDYALSIDFAKRLSMMALTETGEKIYNYFNGTTEHSNYKTNSNSIELIKIQERNGLQAVSARELHQFLESKQEFSNWIKSRIEKYGFIENQDFEVFDNLIKNPVGGRPLTEYALTIDMAKEIAMVEGNEKGKQARRYFIEIEKRAKEMLLQNDFQAMCERRGIKHEDIQHFFTLVDNYIPRPWRPTCKRDIAPLDVTKVVEECNFQRKDLCIEDIDVAEWMKMAGYAQERDGYYFPTQDSLHEGWIDVNEINFYGKKENMVFGLPFITPKGVMYFASMVIEYKIRQNIEQNPHIFFK